MAEIVGQYFMATTVVLVAAVTGLILLHPAIRRSEVWSATVTPLASIIGSGFLIVAPVLGFTVGTWSVIAVSAIVLLAYAVGSAVRYNIMHVEQTLQSKSAGSPHSYWLKDLERIAKLALILAYIVAVAFYLELLGAFALRPFNLAEPALQKTIASALLVLIGGFGYWRGLQGLEFLEKYAVQTKLVVIGGLLAGLVVYNCQELISGRWELPMLATDWSLDSIRRLLGAFLIVQGFETSRYLRGAYPPEMRERTMRYAQWIAAIVYIAFVGPATILLGSFQGISETGIIDIAEKLTAVLPPMLIVGALMSQFSAGIADTISSGGLAEESSGGRVDRQLVYPVVAAIAIVLLWSADIFAIVTLASRAFALYYCIQCTIAALHSFGTANRGYQLRGTFFALLAAAMAATALFATPVESAGAG